MSTSTSSSPAAALIVGRHVRLRAWTPADVPFFVALRNDLATQVALMARPRPSNADRVVDWLTRRTDDDRVAFFVIAAADRDEACGFIELRDIDAVHRRAMLGVAVAFSHRGRGYATEALALIEAYGRDLLGLRKIVLEVRSDHETAAALYARAGYATVGVLAEHFYHDGAFHDVTVMEKRLVGAS